MINRSILFFLALCLAAQGAIPASAYSAGNYPAKWGKSGVMTFIVNQQWRVYQKNLGPATAQIVGAALANRTGFRHNHRSRRRRALVVERRQGKTIHRGLLITSKNGAEVCHD
jgi:kynureninase